jgi:diketogulonate reductase-like aldo/keto reductase
VAHFQVADLQRLAEETHTVPAVNQAELRPHFQTSDGPNLDVFDSVPA